MRAKDPLQLHDDSQARVRVCVRPLHAAQYVNAQLCSPALFDVILQLLEPPQNSTSTSAPLPLLSIQRCLHDFAQLECELQQEVKSNGDNKTAAGVAALPSITSAIKAYLVSRGGDDATATMLYGRDGYALLFEARFAWQLELFLSSLIAYPDPQVNCSQALKKFIRGGSISSSPVKKNEVDDQETIESLFVSRDERSTASAVVHERIPSGCTVERATKVQVTQTSDDDESEGTIEAPASQQALVLWRFASQGDCVVFSARFTEKQQLYEQVESSSEDPYSAADPYKAGESSDLWSSGDGPSESGLHAMILDDGSAMEQYMAQYRTYFSFAPPPSTTTMSPQYVYGAFLAKTSGELVLEWENADTTSVLSKHLEFQVHVLPLLQECNDAGVDGVLKTLLCGGDEAQQEQRGDASWVHEAIMASKVTNLEHILDQRDDDGDDGDDNDDLSNSEEVPRSGSGGGDLGRDTTEQLARLQEEKHFHEQRAKEFEERVLTHSLYSFSFQFAYIQSQLEETLVTVKKELQKARDDIAISKEIYKASLEAITQLEVAASVYQQKPAEAASAVAIPSLLQPSTPSPGIAEDTAEEEGRGAASSVTEKEHQRVVNLCTTFQEQCLWRSIELAESEKRNMVLEGKLQDSEQEKADLENQLAAHEGTVALLQAENKKLRTHKSILVQEVKKLQPYSQINLAALVQEAQEARMMQRSLQAQLDSRTIMIDTTVTTAVLSSVAAEEDGAGGGFVVIESEDHASL